jgi:hypothetical protein
VGECAAEIGYWFFHYENTPAHYALSVYKFLAKNKMTVIPHPPYSPDLESCEFLLFLKLKILLKGRFNIITIIQEKVWAILSSKQCIHKMLRSVALPLGSMYKVPSRLLQWGQH